MVRHTKEELLKSFKKKRRNRKLEEAQELLKMYGFTLRSATKEQGGVWSKGRQLVTLPKPHGAVGLPLPPVYIKFVIEAIENSKLEEALKTKDEKVN